MFISIVHMRRKRLWSERKKAILQTRAEVLGLVRSWFNDHEFCEVQGPVIVPAIAKWSNLSVDYYGLNAFLTSGLEPYAGVFGANLGKSYSISPAFRQETSGFQHLTEYWRIEATIPYGELESIMEVQERLLSYVCQELQRNIQEEQLQNSVNRLRRVRSPFPRLSYEKAVELLAEWFEVQWGATLDQEHETKLSLQHDVPFFIYELPVGVETYYFRSTVDNPLLSCSVDLIAPEGHGELSTGGQPVIGEEVLQKMKKEQLSRPEEQWFRDIEKMGSAPRAGFALGLERLLKWICNLDKVEEATAFPRLREPYP